MCDDSLNNSKCKLIRRRMALFNIFNVWVGTNAPMNADPLERDRKKIAETVLAIDSLYATKWQVTVKGGDKVSENTTENPRHILIRLFGDSEAETFIRALRFAANQLEEQYITMDRRRNTT